jgi:hypothetical protein
MLVAFAVYFIAVEEIHWRIHLEEWLPPGLGASRVHHLAHHACPNARFNIFLPLWDMVLGSVGDSTCTTKFAGAGQFFGRAIRDHARRANRQSTFVENIFVLSVAEDQGSFRAGADYEFGAADPGSDGDKRDGSVRVLAAGDLALPLAEVEDCRIA